LELRRSDFSNRVCNETDKHWAAFLENAALIFRRWLEVISPFVGSNDITAKAGPGGI
jgi:hypothetical protein